MVRILFISVVIILSAWLHAVAGDAIEGFTEPYQDVDVSAAETGILTKIFVVEGDRVQAGQPLAQLDDSVLRAALSIVEAEISTMGRIESAQAELDLQTDLVAKLQELFSQRHASAQELARAVSQKKVLAARLKSVTEERTIKTYEKRRIERQLDQRRILAPISGIVTRVPKQVGEFVSPNDPVAVKVVQLDPLLITFPVPLARTRDLKKSAKVTLVFEEFGELTGEVEFVSPTADSQSGTTRVRIRLPNPGEKIASGVPCRLRLTPQPNSSPASGSGSDSLARPSDFTTR